MAKVLIVSGGWDGHQPFEVARIFTEKLESLGCSVENSDNLDAFKRSADFDVVVPNWTMGSIAQDQVQPLLDAVENGIGVAGIHGGMGDAFRESARYQFMTGGQFVEHPGGDGRKYDVNIVKGYSLTDGMEDFEVATEKYYMHVDPWMKVLATTAFEDYDGAVMPVAWTKKWFAGRVFYCSLGHAPDIVAIPHVLDFVARGILWAADKNSEVQGASFGEVYGGA